MGTSCEICGQGARLWADIKSYPHFRCAECEHLFVAPVPSQQELDEYYAGGRYYDFACRQIARLRHHAASRRAVLDRLAAQFGLERNLLDVGCATGIFLKEMVGSGWHASGIEISQETARHARDETGCGIWLGSVESTAEPRGPFSVITAWEVIEHVRDLRKFMVALVSRLRPGGGLIAFSTPLATSLPARLLGTRFPMLIPPEHLRCFSRASLLRLAHEFGLNPVDELSFSNLSSASLATGYCKYVFGRDPTNAPVAIKGLARIIAVMTAWMPALIDRLGYGTEMQIVFRYDSNELQAD